MRGLRLLAAAFAAGAVFYYEPRLLVRYRVHAAQVSQDELRMREDVYTVHQRYADLVNAPLARKVKADNLLEIARLVVDKDEERPGAARATFMSSLRCWPKPRALAWALVLSTPDQLRRPLCSGWFRSSARSSRRSPNERQAARRRTMSSVATDPRPADAKSGEELAAAAAHGLRWAAIARPATEAIQLCAVVVLARLIVPAEFGRAAIALIAQEAAYLLIAGGLSGALVQRKVLTREHLQTRWPSAARRFTFTVLTLVVAGLIVVPVFGGRTAMFVRLMAPLCLVSAMAAVPAASLQRSMAFRRLSAIEVIGTFVRAVACVGLALAGLEGEALVLGVLAGAVTVGLIMCFSAPPPLPRFHRRAARELLSYGLPASLATVSWVGFSNVDYAIIGARLGALQTGLYFRAYTVAVEYQSKVAMVMGSVGFPVLARPATQSSHGCSGGWSPC